MQPRQLLFALLRQEVCGSNADQDLVKQLTKQGIKDIFALSNRHDLAHIAGRGLEKNVVAADETILSEFKKQTLQAIYRYIKLDHEYQRISKMLEDLKIPYLPLKGSVLRQFYPEPWMRTSCDIDILVKEEDLDAAEAVLTKEMSYVRHSKNGHHISLVYDGTVRLELHYSLLEERYSKKRNQILERVWEAVVPAEGSNYRYEMPDEMFYFYHIAHMAKHLMKGGCGIRTFLDTWILNHRVPHRREKREAILQAGDLLVFEQAAVQLSEVWFSGAEKDALSEQLESVVLTGGLYGNLQNKIAMRRSETGGRIQFVFSRLFAPYAVMKEYYPVLGRHKWLLPYFWIVRFFHRVFHGGIGRSAKELKTNATVSRKQIDYVGELIERLGLR